MAAALMVTTLASSIAALMVTLRVVEATTRMPTIDGKIVEQLQSMVPMILDMIIIIHPMIRYRVGD